MVAKNLKLYGMHPSTCTQKVIFTLLDKNIPFTYIPINVLKNEQKLPDHICRNPFGKIPVLEDEEGNFLFESLAICRYLDRLAPDVGSRLVPEGDREQAMVDQWTYCGGYNFYPNVRPIIFEKAIKPAKGLPTDEAAVVAARALLEPVLDIYESHLSSNAYFAGEEFTLADISHLPYFNVLNRVQQDLISSRPALEAWFDRCTKKESWVATMSWAKEQAAQV
ncbi:hypothetical protein HK097_002542 [Rhizophlyctis rosea]|uniref:glutathione transferase n=1 Tax=Rhizophlyctis rosea TaxID=64517 RepID=A0AAD5X159_9FUNG|nr:hypothetical protein HK097_002542 [Rhizophlyctis rosea]